MGTLFYENESTQHVLVGSIAAQKIYRLIIISSVQAADITPTKKLARKVPNFLSFLWLLFLAVGTWVVVVVFFFYKKASTQNVHVGSRWLFKR
jgi:hypothetical protein